MRSLATNRRQLVVIGCMLSGLLLFSACTNETGADGDDQTTPTPSSETSAENNVNSTSDTESEDSLNTSEASTQTETADFDDAETSGDIDQDINAIDSMFGSVNESDFDEGNLSDENIGL